MNRPGLYPNIISKMDVKSIKINEAKLIRHEIKFVRINRRSCIGQITRFSFTLFLIISQIRSSILNVCRIYTAMQKTAYLPSSIFKTKASAVE
jgi:hypothetical protein